MFEYYYNSYGELVFAGHDCEYENAGAPSCAYIFSKPMDYCPLCKSFHSEKVECDCTDQLLINNAV